MYYTIEQMLLMWLNGCIFGVIIMGTVVFIAAVRK